MKKWPLLLALPLCAGTLALRFPRAQSAPALPIVSNQAELDALARQNPGLDLNIMGHAFANEEARLFWNTDFQSAKRQAAREHKPILMLRLLGNLSDEYSCANSRFFRVVFYPQSQINARLKRDFVLCWTSERPVPVITIDMGDGRKLKRTLTGNSAHYLLDSSGRPLDVFPGLSTPKAFENWLEQSQKLAADFAAQPEANRAVFLANWHETQLKQISEKVSGGPSPLAQSRLKATLADLSLESTAPVLTVAQTRASAAVRLAVTKSIVESPILGATGFGFVNVASSSWSLQQTPLLDAPTRARIKAMNPFESSPVQNVAAPTSKGVPQISQMDVLIGKLEANLVADTKQNENFSPRIHALFARGHEGDFDLLNRRVYDRLFLMPRSDEWLGLTDDMTFSALQNDGIERPNNDVRIAQSR